MSYHFSVTIQSNHFDEVVEKAIEALKRHGFGVLSDIDVQQTFKNKLDIDFRRYRILGACNPNFAHKAIGAERHIGVFLPCNVVIQEGINGGIEISAVDPVASMMSVKNDDLAGVASDVRHLLHVFIEEMKELGSYVSD